jgi:APA family basic amino acid/polyamine antiporter
MRRDVVRSLAIACDDGGPSVQLTQSNEGMPMSKLTDILLRKRVVDTEEKSTHLNRALGKWHLTLLGIGAVIGTGIFVLTGSAAARADGAGPAIVLSFIFTAIACGLAALCYAEFASMVPVAGSAYTYAYAAFGEIFAWIIGWDLILEYAIGNVGVAIGWSGYFNSIMAELGIHIPAWLTVDPMTVHNVIASPTSYSDAVVAKVSLATASTPLAGMYFNLPAFIVVCLVTTLLSIGIKESANANNILVVLKLVMIGLFLFVGVRHVDFATHWAEFAPNGFSGILTGAALVFFAYIGFDAVSTTSEECRDPQRDVPFGMIASLFICTILYVLVAIVLTGIVPLKELNNAEPVAAALRVVGENNVATIIAFGAVLSISSVLLVLQFSQTRIFYSMSRDGLLPEKLSEVHPRFKTPIWATLLTGAMVGLPAALIDITVAAELSNIGTLFAFAMVAIGVLILRYQIPEARRLFRVPFPIIVCPACAIMCFVLMCGLPLDTWIRFFVWMAIGLFLYFCFVLPRRMKSVSDAA